MEQLRLYYYLTKPGIVYGNAIHTLAASLLAYQYGLELTAILGVLVGSSLVIASGCVVNNLIDRNIDAKMARTQKRALVTRQIAPGRAGIFAAVLYMLGLVCLLVFTNLIVVALGILAYVFYVAIYGFAKRRTVHSTLIGSIPGALPAMAGDVAVSGQIDATAWLIFFLIVCWQMPHFYAISLFRREEYAAANLPVLGVIAGEKIVKANMAVFMVSYGVAIAALNAIGTLSFFPTLLMVAGAGGWALIFSQSAGTKVWARQVFKISLVLPIIFLIAAALNVVLIENHTLQ